MSATARVLLVEDDKFLRRACEVSLRRRGFEVTTAIDGEEGLRLAQSAPYADLILLDLLMPKLPGIEVLKALKAQPETSRIPVLILSNSSRDDDRQARDRKLAAPPAFDRRGPAPLPSSSFFHHV